MSVSTTAPSVPFNAMSLLREPSETDLIQTLLGKTSEALVITVSQGKLSVYHKFKDRNGALNNYLIGTLEELVSRSKQAGEHHEATPNRTV